MRAKRNLSLVSALVVAAAACGQLDVYRTAADTPAPVTAVPATAPVTVEPTIELPSPEVSPTELATVAPEVSTPVVTVAPQATEEIPVTSAPVPTATRVVRISTRAEATSTPVAPTSAASAASAAPTSPDSGIYAPLPSPAELRQDARLRWGTGVPSSVRRWAFLMVPIARKYGLDPNLLAAVMTMESNGDPLAWSGADARGLMQILHGPWDPRTNIEDGARMLAGLIARYHSLNLVLAAYNAGPGAVDQYGGVPPYRETRDYVIVVTYLYDLFSHKHLSQHREELYRSTLHDLKKFADQRKKVSVLAKIAHIKHDRALLCAAGTAGGCATPKAERVFISHDPFWPLAGRPDPLQRVDPYAVP